MLAKEEITRTPEDGVTGDSYVPAAARPFSLRGRSDGSGSAPGTSHPLAPGWVRFSWRWPSGEADQQLEAVGIGIAGVRAGPALGRQMLAQEGSEMGRESCHGALPRCTVSLTAAIWAIRMGVACKYQ